MDEYLSLSCTSHCKRFFFSKKTRDCSFSIINWWYEDPPGPICCYCDQSSSCNLFNWMFSVTCAWLGIFGRLLVQTLDTWWVVGYLPTEQWLLSIKPSEMLLSVSSSDNKLIKWRQRDNKLIKWRQRASSAVVSAPVVCCRIFFCFSALFF